MPTPRYRRGSADPAPAPTDWLQVVTQVFGLFAGLATLVYATGAIVLTGRFTVMNIPGDPVVANLPRDFVLSTGAGQVVVPALAVGALYGLFRLLRDKRSRPRVLHRWRDGSETRARVALGYLCTAAAMLVPLVLVLRFGEDIETPDSWEILVASLLLSGAAVAWYEARAVISRRLNRRHRWNSLRPVAVMAGLYVLGAIPAMALAATMIPFKPAKICTTDGFEERGFLVGRSGDSIYLGETSPGQRRLAIFPAGGSQELFVGEEAGIAKCDFDAPRFAVLASMRADLAWKAGKDALAAAAAVRRADGDSAFATEVGNVAAAAWNVSAALEGVADTATGVHSLEDRPALESAVAVAALATALEARLAAFEESSGSRRRGLEADVRRSVDRLGMFVNAARGQARDVAGAVLEIAQEGQPG
ncbi:MAG TPA: hypothetical protein VEW07_06995 [Solirubrobacterales bacterium]|nr:hypothetical protein [Solirubrobacterales bacterium]